MSRKMTRVKSERMKTAWVLGTTRGGGVLSGGGRMGRSEVPVRM